MCKMVGAFLFIISVAWALPARDELMVDQGGDTALVESTVRETRAVPDHIEDLLKPGVKDAYLHTYGDHETDDGDEHGYSKKSNDKGRDGYKHFDSYHKKDGDKYGFETHSEYGKADYAKADAGGKSKKHSDKNEHGDGEETKHSYKVVEELDGGDKKKKAIEDYEGEYGYYGDSGDSEKYSEADGESEGYTDGAEESEGYTEGDGESENYEGGYDEGDGDSGHYTSDDGDSGSYTAAEYDDGESEAYTAEGDEGDY